MQKCTHRQQHPTRTPSDRHFACSLVQSSALTSDLMTVSIRTIPLQKSEHLQSSPGLRTIVQKYSAIIDIIKLPKDTDPPPHLLVKYTSGITNKGVLANSERRSSQHFMFVDNNLLSGIQEHLKPALVCIFEASYILPTNLELHLRQSPLSTDKYFKTT